MSHLIQNKITGDDRPRKRKATTLLWSRPRQPRPPQNEGEYATQERMLVL